MKNKPHHINCVKDETKEITKNVIATCVEEAGLGQDTVPNVYKKVVSTFHDKGIHFIQNIPSYKQVKSTIYRKRNEHFQVPLLSCNDACVLEIPTQYTDMLLADFNDEDNRILLFCSKEARRIIPNIKIILLDGTFEVCPAPFTELYTMHGDLGSSDELTNIIPLVYVLITKKTKEMYVRMLELIKSTIPGFSPTEIITDFERAAIAAVQEVFPNANYHGCYFHFTRALRRKAKKLHLSNDIFLQRIVSLCTVLPFLPLSELDNGWVYIKAEVASISNDNLLKFVKYMESFWLKNDFRKSWCCFGIKHRTTNSVESWHHNFVGHFKRTPPSFIIFLTKMAEDAIFNKIKAIKVLNKPKSLTKREKKNINRDRYILENQLQLTIGEISVEMFLNKTIYLSTH